jgi:phosphoribosylamine-glycine ligase
MKILIIDDGAEALDFCLLCKRFGHDIKWYVPPDGKDTLVGKGYLKREADWEKWMDWADLIFLTDNTKMLRQLSKYRKRGYPVFGPTFEGAQLELDREKGQEMFEKHGIKIMPFEKFSDTAKAEKYVLANMKRYVCKPCGDAAKEMSYVSKSPADMIFMLRRWKELGKIKGDFILQEFVPGIEIAVGGWLGPMGFANYFCENFEHKKLMDQEKGPNTGEMGCYSDDSEVLTKNGWKFWPDVTIADEIASLVDGKTVFQKPLAVVAYDYVGPMVTWKNRALDVCVTPNHNMYVRSQWNFKNDIDSFEFVQAENCTQSQYEIKRSAGWGGVSPEFYSIPEYSCGKGLGTQVMPPLRIPMVAWAKFLGVYIAEGSCGASANIAQSHPVKSKKVRAIIEATGLPFAEKDNGFLIHRKQVAAHLKPLGGSWEKSVPDYIKNGSKEIIEAFLEGYALGDGNTQANGFRIFYTTSKKLSDDVQELLLKIGRVGMVKSRDRIGRQNMLACGRTITSRRISYEVVERVQKVSGWLDKRDRSTEMYAGKVYCAEVPGHVMYVRRNGKPMWCGNTVIKYVELAHSQLAKDLLIPMEQDLISMGITGYVDIACIVDEKGDPRPLEFTVRPGWPTFNIQCALVEGDPAEWMLDLLNGKDSHDPSTDVATGVVLAIPDFPYGKRSDEEVCGFPIYGLPDLDENDFHLCQARLCEAPAMNEDETKVITENIPCTAGTYVLVTTGHGETVEQSIEQAYENIDKIDVPNSPFHRTDIGQRLRQDVPKLQSYGFCESWTFD